MRLTGILGVGPAQQANAAAHRALADVQMVPVGRDALHQAQQPMLAIVHTLDAIHIATALDVLQREPDLLFATHDRQQAAAATALGLKVIGV
jgi:hypothetical protein